MIADDQGLPYDSSSSPSGTRSPSETGSAPDDQPAGPETEDSAPSVELDFADDQVGQKLRHATDEQIDAADFGIIEVDDDGFVQQYNRYESRLSGIDPEDTIGESFFETVAPCTYDRLFYGRFQKGVEQDALDAQFTFRFTYRMTPTTVKIRMHRDETGRNWILVNPFKEPSEIRA
jgi:photoactive yellow protein